MLSKIAQYGLTMGPINITSDLTWTVTDPVWSEILVPELITTLSGMFKNPYCPSLVASVQDYQRTSPVTSPTMVGARVEDTLRRQDE